MLLQLLFASQMHSSFVVSLWKHWIELTLFLSTRKQKWQLLTCKMWTSEPVVKARMWTLLSSKASIRKVESIEMSMWSIALGKNIWLRTQKVSKDQMDTEQSVDPAANISSSRFTLIQVIIPRWCSNLPMRRPLSRRTTQMAPISEPERIYSSLWVIAVHKTPATWWLKKREKRKH